MRKYKRLSEESKTEKEWYLWFKDAPEDVKNDAIEYWANKKILWNRKDIRLSKSDIKELVKVQKALDKLGIDNKAFLSHVTV